MEKRAPCLVYLKHCSPSNPLPTILHPCLSFNVLICKMGIIVFIEVRMGKMPCKPKNCLEVRILVFVEHFLI